MISRTGLISMGGGFLFAVLVGLGIGAWVGSERPESARPTDHHERMYPELPEGVAVARPRTEQPKASSDSEEAASVATTSAPDSGTASPGSGGPTGTIRGMAILSGEPPKRLELTGIAQTQGCAAHGETPLTETVIVDANGGLQNVFVYIKKGLKGDPPPPASPTVTIDQKGCTYRPHMIGMQLGQTLQVTNSDEATHNINANATRRNQGFNRSQGAGGAPLTWKPEKREICVPFKCDIHPWMRAYVGVVDSPYFAVTAADGSFEIPAVPPGSYTLEAWHEKYDKQSAKLVVVAGRPAEARFSFD